MEENTINAIANSVRIKLLCCLTEGSRNVEELIQTCGLAQSAVSQHLAKLKKAGVVRTKRKGRFIYYSLANKKTGDVALILKNYLKEVN